MIYISFIYDNLSLKYPEIDSLGEGRGEGEKCPLLKLSMQPQQRVSTDEELRTTVNIFLNHRTNL